MNMNDELVKKLKIKKYLSYFLPLFITIFINHDIENPICRKYHIYYDRYKEYYNTLTLTMNKDTISKIAYSTLMKIIDDL